MTTKPPSDTYTEKEWAELMFATPSEVREHYIKQSKKHGLLKFLKGIKHDDNRN
jgi:hypothetical protein